MKKSFITVVLCTFTHISFAAVQALSAYTDGTVFDPNVVTSLSIVQGDGSMTVVMAPKHTLEMRTDYFKSWEIEKTFDDEDEMTSYVQERLCSQSIDDAELKLCGKPEGGFYGCLPIGQGNLNIKIRRIQVSFNRLGLLKSTIVTCP